MPESFYFFALIVFATTNLNNINQTITGRLHQNKQEQDHDNHPNFDPDSQTLSVLDWISPSITAYSSCSSKIERTKQNQPEIIDQGTGGAGYEGVLRLRDGQGKCAACGKTFNSAYSTKRHYIHAHGSGKDAFVHCGQCHAVVKNELCLKNHLRRVHRIYATKPEDRA